MSTTAQPLAIPEREAAELLGVSERTLFNLRQENAIPFVRIRSRIMYRVSALEKWLQENEQGAAK
jgi:excisionase family DNA binding protein